LSQTSLIQKKYKYLKAIVAIIWAFHSGLKKKIIPPSSPFKVNQKIQKPNLTPYGV
jgi:hypothetical protein